MQVPNPDDPRAAPRTCEAWAMSGIYAVPPGLLDEAEHPSVKPPVKRKASKKAPQAAGHTAAEEDVAESPAKASESVEDVDEEDQARFHPCASIVR